MKESEVEAMLVRGVQLQGGLCWKFVSPGRAGVPDRIVVLPDGRVIFVELKTDTGQLRPIQIYQHRELQARRADVRTLFGAKDVLAFLEEVVPK